MPLSRDRAIRIFAYICTQYWDFVGGKPYDEPMQSAIDKLDKGVKDKLVSDIARKKGYENSQCSMIMSRATFYKYKKQFIKSVSELI